MADEKDGVDPNFGKNAFVGVAAAVPLIFVAILFVILMIVWIIPMCLGTMKHNKNRPTERLDKLEHAVKSERFVDWAKKEQKRRPEGQYDEALCVICLEIFDDASQIRGLQCHHVFHRRCLDDWFSRYNEYCPLCHRSIIPGASQSTPRRRNEQPLVAFMV